MLVLAAYYIFRILKIYTKPIAEIITFVPDDAFYYLTIAKQRNTSAIWTFDGENSTTGFHLIHAKVIQFIFSVFPEVNFKTLFLIMGVLSSLSLSFFFCAILKNIKPFEKERKLIVLVVFLLPAVTRLTELMMEAWLIALILGTILFLLRIEKKSFILGFTITLLGILGVFSRSDFILFAISLFSSTVLVRLLQNLRSLPGSIFSNNTLKLHIPKYLLLGSLTGEIFLALYNYMISNEWLQMSVQIKKKWSELLGNPIELSLNQLVKFISPWELTTISLIVLKVFICIFAILYACILLVIFKRTIKSTLSIQDAMILTYTLLSIPVLTLFYRLDAGSLQPWYAVNYIPTMLCLYLSVNIIVKNRILIIIVSSIFVGIAVSNFSIGAGIQGQFKSQEIMYKTAIVLNEEQYQGKIGAWNAGILKYFSDQNVINLDGLMNDSAADFSINSNLNEYISANSINRLIDFSETIENEKSEKRYGLSPGEINRCFEKVKIFIATGTPSPFGEYVEYRAKASCR